jgi:hypothetical protein
MYTNNTIYVIDLLSLLPVQRKAMKRKFFCPNLTIRLVNIQRKFTEVSIDNA